MKGLDRLGVGPIELVAAVSARLDEADVAQDAQVFGHRRLIESQDGHDLSDRKLFHDKKGEDLAAPRLSHRVEDIRSGCGARHERDITFPYGNMSSVICFTASIFPGPVTGTGRQPAMFIGGSVGEEGQQGSCQQLIPQMDGIGWFKPNTLRSWMRSCLFALIFLICVPVTLHSQSEAPAHYQLYGGYTWLSNTMNGFPGARQSLNGWDVSLAFGSWHSVRFKLDAYGYHGTNLNAPQHALFILAGAQYSHKIRRETVFADGLIGDATLNRNWGPQGTRAATNGFTSLVGGGLDTPITRRFAYRVNGGFQYSYTALIGPGPEFGPYRVRGLPTYFGRISTGVVWLF
jgi:hypothetical protein